MVRQNITKDFKILFKSAKLEGVLFSKNRDSHSTFIWWTNLKIYNIQNNIEFNYMPDRVYGI